MGQILLGLDVETTGLDSETARITEIGWAIFDTESLDKPLKVAHFYSKDAGEIPEDVVELTSITSELLARCGVPEHNIIAELIMDLVHYRVDFLVAHNAPFDRKFVRKAVERQGMVLELDAWIDTQRDVPYPAKTKSFNLTMLCVDHGFMNPFPHSALFDVLSMMKLLSNYAIERVLEYRAQPTVILRALVDYDNKDKAKKLGFYWENCEDEVFPKQWVKAVKRPLVEAFKAKASFTIRELKEVTR